jgi:CRP-like cAMP-binding protein
MISTPNLLLRSLGPEDLQLIEPALWQVTLAEGDVLASAGDPIETICFLEGGVASYSNTSPSCVRTGIAMVGYEGCAGWHALLGSDVAPYDIAVAVGGGTALMIKAQELVDFTERRPSLRNLMMRFVRSMFAQIGQTAISNVNDPVQGRLCRWLLMNHDRLEGDEIQLSHNEIGNMLGVRRASVTDALHILEGEGLISAKRKSICVRDRARLRACAGDSYGVPEAEYRRLIAPFGKDLVLT